MDNPNANKKALSKSQEAKNHQQQKESYTSGEMESNVIDFPIVKYYNNSDLILKKHQKVIKSAGLIDFLHELKLTINIAQYYFHEVHIFNKSTREKIHTLGFLNEEDGFELINPFFKGIIGEKAISFIRGKNPKPEIIHIFKESLDFIAFLNKAGSKKIYVDAIILHSNSCIEQIKPYIQNYGYKKVYSWMDNDKAGFEAKIFIQNLAEQEEKLKHKPMNNLYKPFKNVQTWYQKQVLNEI